MNEELQFSLCEADFSQSDHALVDWIAKRWPEGLGPMAVDLGCGPEISACCSCSAGAI